MSGKHNLVNLDQSQVPKVEFCEEHTQCLRKTETFHVEIWLENFLLP